MRNLAKSAVTFPWAISMFGLQQMANLMSPREPGRFDSMATALDAVTDATERQLDGWTKQTYTVGTAVQRGLVDAMMMRPPAIDSAALMRSMETMQSSPIFQAMVKYAMPPVAWLDSFLVARADSPAVLQEFANKLYIIQLVTQVHTDFGLDDSNEQSISQLIDRAAEKETFPRLWIVEGIGNYAGDRAMKGAEGGADPEGLLTDPALASLPPWSLTMLHAGIGMSFAKAVLKGLDPDMPSEVVQSAITRFIALCRRSSRPGYAGAALESLGLATRTLYPRLMPVMDRELPLVDGDVHQYFWHGVGRAMYFDPMNMLPSVNAPWRMIAKLPAEATHDVAYRNALAGIAWAIAVVNMRNPLVMEAFLRHHGALVTEQDAFTNGVTSSLMMRYDTTRLDSHIDPFVRYDTSIADPAMASLWRSVIGGPCERALQTTYGQLQRTGTLEELFRYHAGSR